MNEFKKIKSSGVDVIQLGAVFVFQGTAANETAVFAEVGAIDAIGSLYLSTTGIYFQVANNGVDADWEKVTTTHT
jgi:hypothetical protein